MYICHIKLIKMKNEIKKITVAANVTYGNITQNTPLHIEYKHTGEQFYTERGGIRHTLSGKESAEQKKAQGKKVKYSTGYYFIYRLAIPTINAKGEKDIWYINNGDDYYMINKVSKYGRRVHQQMSAETKSNF